jgi:hypothetical protein
MHRGLGGRLTCEILLPVCRLHYQVCLLLWIQVKDTFSTWQVQEVHRIWHRVSVHLEIHQGSQDIGGGFWIAPCIELCLTLPLSSTGHYVYLVRLGTLRSRKMKFDAGMLGWHSMEQGFMKLCKSRRGICSRSRRRWHRPRELLTILWGVLRRLLKPPGSLNRNQSLSQLAQFTTKCPYWVRNEVPELGEFKTSQVRSICSFVLSAQLCYAFGVELPFCFCSIAFCGSQRTVLVTNVTGLQNHDLYFPQLLIYLWTTGNKFHKNKDRILEAHVRGQEGEGYVRRKTNYANCTRLTTDTWH